MSAHCRRLAIFVETLVPENNILPSATGKEKRNRGTRDGGKDFIKSSAMKCTENM